LFAGN
jgi:hypothetical protein